MKSHDLARYLRQLPNKKITASVDISTGQDDHGNRVFGDFIGINDMSDDVGAIVLLFENGETNY